MDEELLSIMQGWKDGLWSDVEALYRICADLPSSPVTDMVIEIVGKMCQEEVAEWEEPRLEGGPIIEHSVEDFDQPRVDPHSDSKL